jgi:hypothetical protein
MKTNVCHPPVPCGLGFGLFLHGTLVAKARLARNLPGSNASQPHTYPLFRGISCYAGGGFMHVDAALPLNDWYNIHPVGHTKGITLSGINSTILLADKVKTHRS